MKKWIDLAVEAALNCFAANRLCANLGHLMGMPELAQALDDSAAINTKWLHCCGLMTADYKLTVDKKGLFLLF